MTCSTESPVGGSISIASSLIVALALGLQGCGGGDSSGPPPQPVGWNLAPIEVKGSHLYNSKTGEQFHPRGIGFPNVGTEASVEEWIAVLKRIAGLSKEINAIRIYEPPSCATAPNSACFESFMKAADDLGIYVLVPGSGDTWGWFPGLPDKCGKPFSLQRCYEAGGVLGFGRQIVANFHYPNTLAIVIANEVEQNLQAFPVLKAYARDLKNFMNTCNTDSASPTKGEMRQIPLMYAATDGGNDTYAEGDYLFCGDKSDSIDIFGLNIERWVNDVGGRQEYNKVDSSVADHQWPGAFVHSEEGGPYGQGQPDPVPTWNQLPGFFKDWKAIDGFFGYVYYGHPQYNMFDGPSANATELPDGVAFFDKLSKIEAGSDIRSSAVKTPQCLDSITWKGNTAPLAPYSTVSAYHTGPSGTTLPQNCPQPLMAAKGVKVTKGTKVIV